MALLGSYANLLSHQQHVRGLLPPSLTTTVSVSQVLLPSQQFTGFIALTYPEVVSWPACRWSVSADENEMRPGAGLHGLQSTSLLQQEVPWCQLPVWFHAQHPAPMSFRGQPLASAYGEGSAWRSMSSPKELTSSDHWWVQKNRYSSSLAFQMQQLWDATRSISRSLLQDWSKVDFEITRPCLAVVHPLSWLPVLFPRNAPQSSSCIISPSFICNLYSLESLSQGHLPLFPSCFLAIVPIIHRREQIGEGTSWKLQSYQGVQAGTSTQDF